MTNMKIQYASDLHLEFADNWRYLKAHPLEVTGDILLLAGDIGYLGDDNYSKHPFWDWASENYKEVHCCMGNHEFYKYYDVATLPDGYLLEVMYSATTTVLRGLATPTSSSPPFGRGFLWRTLTSPSK